MINEPETKTIPTKALRAYISTALTIKDLNTYIEGFGDEVADETVQKWVTKAYEQLSDAGVL